MPLDLIVGPANAGKVAELYRRYRACLEDEGEAILVVPTSAAVRRAEAELLSRGVLVGGLVVTFDAVFERVLRLAGHERTLLGSARRRLELSRLAASVPLPTIGASAAGARFAEALGGLFDRLGSALVGPDRFAAAARGDEASVDLAGLYSAWWERLDALAALDAPRRRAEACDLLAREVAAWDGTRLYVQGFEDLSRAQETLVRLVADRAGATMTLPYEPGRAAFAALAGSAGRLAAGAQIIELPPLNGARPRRLEALERHLFEAIEAPPAESDDDSLTLLEAAGARAEADLVLAEVCAALRSGVPAERIAIVTPRDPGGWPEILSALDRAAVPYAAERVTTVARTPFGFALERLLRAAWDQDAVRGDLFAFLRSPWSGLARRRVDYAEGRLRGRAIVTMEAVEAALAEQLPGADAPLGCLRGDDPLGRLGETVRRMIVAAQGLDGRPVSAAARLDLAAARAVLELLDELASVEPPPSRDEARSLVLRARVVTRMPPEGRVLVCDLRAARVIDADLVVLVGLERGPAAEAADAFLGEPVREALGDALRAADAGDLERHLLYVALARGRRRVVACRRSADDEGRPIEPPAAFAELQRAGGGAAAARRRGLGDVVFSVAAAPTARERVRAVCHLAQADRQRAERIAAADGSGRRLRRATTAYRRRTRLRDPDVLARLGGLDRFPVTTLERFADCSSWWFVERHLDPRDIDATYDARLAGSVAHSALQRFYKGVPAAFGRDRLEPPDAERAEELIRQAVAESMASQSLPADTLEARIVERRVARDLARFVRQDAERPSPLVATRLEVSFGGANSAPGLKDGLRIGDFAVSGKIDRIDTDPSFSAHALVQDYKSGRTAHSASQIVDERRLQIPLYLLAARELLGLEPIGGLYRALAPGGGARGVVARSAADVAPAGLVRTDIVDDDELWRIVDLARSDAVGIVARIRAGDVGHDPRWGSCPRYCPYAAVCRVAR